MSRVDNRQLEHLRVEVERIRIDSPKFKSILVVYQGEEIWVPRSQIHAIERAKAPSLEAVIWVTPWIAKKLGMEGQ